VRVSPRGIHFPFKRRVEVVVRHQGLPGHLAAAPAAGVRAIIVVSAL